MKLIVMGPAGRMGRDMARIAHAGPGITLSGGVGPGGRDYIGRDLGLVIGLGKKLNIPVSDSLTSVIRDADVVADCTAPAAAMAALDVCIRHRIPFVSGTTGFTPEQKQAFADAGNSIPVLWASNTSRTMQLLFDLVRRAAGQMTDQVAGQTGTDQIGTGADIDIMDIHDNQKPDAPSGTALEIADIISRETGLDPEQAAFGRKGFERRKPGTLAFTSIRSGGEPGSIRVMFGLENESMTLSARVHNMETYARGMVDAARFLHGKPPGLYTIREAMGL